LRSLLTALVVICGIAAWSGCGERPPSAVEQAAAAARESEQAAAAKAREERLAALETERLAAIWTYHDVPVEQGRQRTAAIRATDDVDTDGQGAKAVQLVFRDHPSWGRSSYLVLQAGDFDCSPRCTAGVTADETEPVRMAARRPNTDEAIAMFIDDAQSLWRLTSGATRISIEFPVKAGGTRTARFDVAGLDEHSMPGWNGDAGPSPR
jgi:hypothetical protein